MAFSDIYRKQAELLVRILPHVAQEECFALKGGTAINLFVRNLPRLSVDIDLTYLPLSDRSQALVEIEAALRRIAERIKSMDTTVTITESAPSTQKAINKLVIRTRERVQIKIEVTPVLRGCVYKPEVMTVVEAAENEFGFAEINVLSIADLYAGKILAALDRQHPRDLFDVRQLFEHEGITNSIRTAFIVYLISHDHSPHSLLAPTPKDISRDFELNFSGMTRGEVNLETLLDARTELIADIVNNMPDDHKQFLLSFYHRNPDWDLLSLKHIAELPAVKWREQNLDRAGKGTRDSIVHKIEKLLAID